MGFADGIGRETANGLDEFRQMVRKTDRLFFGIWGGAGAVMAALALVAIIAR